MCFIMKQNTRTHRQSTSYTNTGLEVSTDYYLVNADGNIEFPIIGPLHVAGLTKNQVAEVVVNAIYPIM